jgi:hypothetical protein
MHPMDNAVTVSAYSAAAAAHAGLAIPNLNSDAAISFKVSATGVSCSPSSCCTLLLLMWLVSASAPSGSAAAAAGYAALSVSVMKCAEIDWGWLTMYLKQQQGKQRKGGRQQ